MAESCFKIPQWQAREWKMDQMLTLGNKFYDRVVFLVIDV